MRAQRKGNNNKDNPDALCLPLGLTQLHMHPQPREIVQTPREIVVLYEANGNVRRILTDGRALPNNDPEPWWYGYSAGHWDGDTLVVETTGFRDDVWLDVEGSPLTGSGKMTERWRRPKYGLMQIDITIEDPKAYTKAVHGAGEPSTHGGHRAHGVRLPGERRKSLTGQGREEIMPARTNYWAAL